MLHLKPVKGLAFGTDFGCVRVQEKVTWRFLCWVCEAGGINKIEETYSMGTNRKRHKRHLGQRPRRHDSPGKVQFSPRSGSDWTRDSGI